MLYLWTFETWITISADASKEEISQQEHAPQMLPLITVSEKKKIHSDDSNMSIHLFQMDNLSWNPEAARSVPWEKEEERLIQS